MKVHVNFNWVHFFLHLNVYHLLKSWTCTLKLKVVFYVCPVTEYINFGILFVCGNAQLSTFLSKITTAGLMKSQIRIQYNSPW